MFYSRDNMLKGEDSTREVWCHWLGKVVVGVGGGVLTGFGRKHDCGRGVT